MKLTKNFTEEFNPREIDSINSMPDILIEEEPTHGPLNTWPTLSETIKTKEISLDKRQKEGEISFNSDQEWENLSSESDCGLLFDEDDIISRDRDNTSAEFEQVSDTYSLHTSISTPTLSKLEEDESYVFDFASNGDGCSVAASSTATFEGAVLVSQKKSTTMKKIPSFKDIIMLNAQAREEEDKKKKELLQQYHDKVRRDTMTRRKATRPRLVVNPIKRCSKSTGDLKSMIIKEDVEKDYGYDSIHMYGGGGLHSSIISEGVEEEDVLGDTDSAEFYSRKMKGASSRRNGRKLRPDEAKRRNMIVYRKDAQRRAQNKN